MLTEIEDTTGQTEQFLLQFCRQNKLFAPGDRVIAACSGGADSMALLLFLLRCRQKLEISVAATHVNHGLRGAAADADAGYVTAFCQKQKIECYLFDARAAGETIPPHASENWARQLRYRWFERLADEQHAKIAIAHTLSDQTETVLFRMARGTGLHGLAGIPAVRGVYVRPMLCLTRTQTAGYCAALGQSYVQDATNADDSIPRNRIRHQAVPALEYANSAALRSVGRLCGQMRQLDDWLEAQAQELLERARRPQGYLLKVLCAQDGPVLDRALYRLASPQKDVEEKSVHLLKQLVLSGHGRAQLTGKLDFAVQDGFLICLHCCAEPPAPLAPLPFQAPKTYRLPGGFEMRAELVNYEVFLKSSLFLKKDSNCCADYAKIRKNIFLRTRCAGDIYHPAGRHIGKSLKKFYNEESVPVQRRALLPLLASGSEVLWLWGFGFAEGLVPQTETQEVLILHTQENRGITSNGSNG
jgi:tRNA(Ile)-lysidine synthase